LDTREAQSPHAAENCAGTLKYTVSKIKACDNLSGNH